MDPPNIVASSSVYRTGEDRQRSMRGGTSTQRSLCCDTILLYHVGSDQCDEAFAWMPVGQGCISMATFYATVDCPQHSVALKRDTSAVRHERYTDPAQTTNQAYTWQLHAASILYHSNITPRNHNSRLPISPICTTCTISAEPQTAML